MKKSFYLMAVLLLGMGMVLGTSCSDDDNDGDGDGGGGTTTEKLMPVKIRIENTTGVTVGAAMAANEEVGGEGEMGGDDTGGDIEEYYGSWMTYELTWLNGKLKSVISNTGDMATPNTANPNTRVQYAFTYNTDQVVIRYSQTNFYGNTENHVLTCELNDKGYIESAKDMKNDALFMSYEVVYNNGRLEKFRRLAAEPREEETPEWEDFFACTYETSQNFTHFYSVYDYDAEYEPINGNWACTFGQQANNMAPNLNLLALNVSEGGDDVCFVLTALAGLLPANANYIEKRTYEQQHVDYQWTKSGEEITGLNISGEVTDNLGSDPVIKMTFGY